MPEGDASLSPDNARVLFLAGANNAFETYYNDNIFVVPAAGGPARNLTMSLPYEVESAAWSKGPPRNRSTSSPTWACTRSCSR